MGDQPSSSRVIALDAFVSTVRKRASQPNCGGTSPSAKARTSSSSPRPMASAIARCETPSSPTACSMEPAGAFSAANRTSTAPSARLTTGQVLDPPTGTGQDGLSRSPTLRGKTLRPRHPALPAWVPPRDRRPPRHRVHKTREAAIVSVGVLLADDDLGVSLV